MKKRCQYCRQWYDSNKEHNCELKIKKQKEYKNNYQKNYYQENKDDLGYKLLHSQDWSRFRKQIILLDGGYCQRCYKKNGTYVFSNLEVHHIMPRTTHPELTFDFNNVVTVCKKCNLELGLNGIDFDWSPQERDYNNNQPHL